MMMIVYSLKEGNYIPLLYLVYLAKILHRIVEHILIYVVK
jgi:hypothetical protein